MSLYEMVPKRLYISGSLSDENWTFVRRNLNVVVNLRTKPDQPPFYSPHITYYWFPMTIKVAPTLQFTIDFSDKMNGIIDRGHRMLIHDRLGIQRLGYAIIAVFMKRFQLTLKQALMEVRKIKPDLEPTPNYMEVLIEYEKHLYSNTE